ncbi:MAG: molecular chaperone TorD family protein [Ignavibacteriales bacterium]|nr:molecular chaperone TorD family protein [Ignavibacteriales bacterium]
MNTTALGIEATTAEVRARIYRVLAKVFQYPSKENIKLLSQEQHSNALLRNEALSSELTCAIRDVLAMLTPTDAGLTVDRLEYEYNRLFAHLGSAKCPPYETEYGYDNVFQKTQAMADIAGFYYAYGLDVADDNTERVDFIGTELEFMSFLALNEAYARENGNADQLEICVDTQRKFLRDHLGRWTAVFVKILMNSSDNHFYREMGRLTTLLLHDEAVRLDVALNEVVGPNKDVEKKPDPFDCSACMTHK